MFVHVFFLVFPERASRRVGKREGLGFEGVKN
jgi:hypothetical protein